MDESGFQPCIFRAGASWGVAPGWDELRLWRTRSARRSRRDSRARERGAAARRRGAARPAPTAVTEKSRWANGPPHSSLGHRPRFRHPRGSRAESPSHRRPAAWMNRAFSPASSARRLPGALPQAGMNLRLWRTRSARRPRRDARARERGAAARRRGAARPAPTAVARAAASAASDRSPAIHRRAAVGRR